MPKMRRQSTRTQKEYRRQYEQRRRGNCGAENVDENAVTMDGYPFSLTSADIKAGLTFNAECGKFEIEVCTICNRSFPGLKVTNGRCNYCKDHTNNNKYSAENNIDPGPVPPELQDLTYIEQLLIARVHSIVSIFRIKGAQYGYSGNVINFRQNISEYIKRLPIHPKNLPSTILFNKETAVGNVQFEVRSHKLYAALVWLKEHNMYYKDIEIDLEVLNELLEINNVALLLPSAEMDIDEDVTQDHVEESFVPLLENINQEKIIKEELRLDYPSLSSEPINEFTSEGYIARAFPTLFPTGKGDYLQPRMTNLTLREYHMYLMLYKDGRFAKDPRFRFFAFNTTMRHSAIFQATYYTNKEYLTKLSLDELKKTLKITTFFSKTLCCTWLICVLPNHIGIKDVLN